MRSWKFNSPIVSSATLPPYHSADCAQYQMKSSTMDMVFGDMWNQRRVQHLVQADICWVLLYEPTGMMLNVGCTDPAIIHLAAAIHGWIEATGSTFMVVVSLLGFYAQQSQLIPVTLGILLSFRCCLCAFRVTVRA